VLTLHFQKVLEYGPLVAGLLFLPMTPASAVAAPVAGQLATPVAAGLLLMTGVSESGGLTLVLSGTVVGEAGFMLPNVSLRIAATGGADRDERGLVAGLLNT
jgi:hypothetical protein